MIAIFSVHIRHSLFSLEESDSGARSQLYAFEERTSPANPKRKPQVLRSVAAPFWNKLPSKERFDPSQAFISCYDTL